MPRRRRCAPISPAPGGASEIPPVKGVTLIGPLPAEIRKVTIYQAAATAKARDPATAKAFLEYLRSPEVRAIAAKKGFMEER